MVAQELKKVLIFKGLNVAKQHPLLFMILCMQICMIAYTNLFKLQFFLGYDCSAYYLQAVEMCKQGTLIPEHWDFQTTLFWDSPVLLAIFIYAFCDNIFLAYGIANLLITICLIVVLYLIGNQFGLSDRAKLVLLIGFLTPYYAEITIYNNIGYYNVLFGAIGAYSVKLLIILSIWLCFFLLMQVNAGRTCEIYALLIIVLCFVSGISSGYYVFVFGIAPVWLFYIFRGCVDNELLGQKKKALIFIVLCTVGVVFGKYFATYILNFSSQDTFAIWTSLDKFVDNLFSIFLGLFSLLGALPLNYSLPILSVEGLQFGFRLMYDLTILGGGLYLIIKNITVKKHTDLICNLFSWIFVGILLVLIFCYTKYGAQIFEDRYLIPGFIIILLFFSKWTDDLLSGQMGKNLVLCVFFLLSAIVTNYASWDYIYKSQNQHLWYSEIIEKIGGYSCPIVYMGGDMGLTARNIRVWDINHIYKYSENMKTPHHWGDYTYYDENSEYAGSTILVCKKSFYDELPVYYKEAYELVDTIENTEIGIYYASYNPVDFKTGLPESKFSQDFMYTAGICTSNNGVFEEDGSFTVVGKNDFAFWGPYVPAPPGKYNFTLNYEVINDPKDIEIVGEFDIALDSVGFKKTDIVADKNSVTISGLELTEAEAGKLLEYRAYIYDDINIKLKSVEIERMD